MLTMLCLPAKRVVVLSSLLVFITVVEYLIVCVLYERITSDSDSRWLGPLTRSLATVRWTEEWQSNENRTKVTATFHTVSQVVQTASHGTTPHEQRSSDILPTQEKHLGRDKRDNVSVASKHTLGFGLDGKIGARDAPKQSSLHTDQLHTGIVNQGPRVAVPATSVVQRVDIEGNRHVDRGKEPPSFRDSERTRRLKEALENEQHQEATQPEYLKRHLSLKDLRNRRARLGGTSEPSLVSENLHVGNTERHDHLQPRFGVHSNDIGDDSVDGRHRNPAMQRTRIVLNQQERGNSKLPMENFAGNSLLYFAEVCGEKLEPLVECSDRVERRLSHLEQEGRNIMFTMRTTVGYHRQRLPLLFQTWLTTVSPDTVFIVTDGHDPVVEDETQSRGMEYVIAQSGSTYLRSDLCCKAGVELELLFRPQSVSFDWLCHVDDDIYVNLKVLVKTLAVFDPKTEPVYFGRAGTEWGKARQVSENSTIGRPGQRYHFAVGGMYCLSRAMLERAKPYLVGCRAFSESCSKAQEPEDVTVGLIVGVVLEQTLARTEMIYTHGLDLISTAPSPFLKHQIAFSYGYGSVEPWSFMPNVLYVPGALYSLDEDETQLRSLHCHLYPLIQQCKDKKKALLELKLQKRRGKPICICAWESLFCCQRYINATIQLLKKG